MRRHLIGALLVLSLLLTGCSSGSKDVQKRSTELLLEEAAVSMEEGHLFFRGKVLSVTNESRQITYYDAETGKNTFYQVEVTEDLFGCMPERIITVCVAGTSESFSQRQTLVKNREYFFDTRIWADETQAIFLLPTFYDALPECRDETLLQSYAEITYDLGEPDAYSQALKELADEKGYGPEQVRQAALSQLTLAKDNSNKDHFDALEFETLDEAALAEITATAETLLNKLESVPATWSGIKEGLS